MLKPLPPAFADTREALHRIAEEVVAPVASERRRSSTMDAGSRCGWMGPSWW